MERKNWINIFVLGFGFFLLFSAFQTAMFIQALTIGSFLSPDCNKNTTMFGVVSEELAVRIGFISGSIIYLMVAIGNWVSVSVVAVFGAKWSLVVSGALYVIYIACLIRPLIYSIFLGAFILGSGGGVLWTAQGQILIQNSSKKRMGTTSGIFWFMLQMSLVVGSIYLTIYFYVNRNDKDINCFPPQQNYILFGVLTFVAIIGVIVLVFIVPVRSNEISPSTSQKSINSASTLSKGESEPLMTSKTLVLTGIQDRKFPPVLQALINAIKMLFTKKMMLLCVTFVYTGYELNFWSGVFGTIVGHTGAFPRYYVGMGLFFIGIAEIIGGALFGIFGPYTNRWGRDIIVLLGFCCHLICFMLVFLFFSEDAIANVVIPENSYGALGIYNVHSNVYVTMTCAFLLGFGDACFNTQWGIPPTVSSSTVCQTFIIILLTFGIYSIIGALYPTDEKSAPAMALFKFFQSITAMIGFLTNSFVLLQWQLLILVVLLAVATFTFWIVEWEYYHNEKDRERNLTASYEQPNENRYIITKPHVQPQQRTKSIGDDDKEDYISDSSVY